MENIPTVDQDTATIVRHITAEVKQGKPIKIIHNEVDVNLMNKLFSGKRFMSVTPRNIDAEPPKKKKSELEEERVDKTLMNMLFRDEKKTQNLAEAAAIRIPGDSASQIVPRIQAASPPALAVHDAPRNLPPATRRLRAMDDFTRLQREALEAQIAKDKIIAQYYKRKLELLEEKTEIEHEA